MTKIELSDISRFKTGTMLKQQAILLAGLEAAGDKGATKREFYEEYVAEDSGYRLRVGEYKSDHVGLRFGRNSRILIAQGLMPERVKSGQEYRYFAANASAFSAENVVKKAVLVPIGNARVAGSNAFAFDKASYENDTVERTKITQQSVKALIETLKPKTDKSKKQPKTKPVA